MMDIGNVVDWLCVELGFFCPAPALGPPLLLQDGGNGNRGAAPFTCPSCTYFRETPAWDVKRTECIAPTSRTLWCRTQCWLQENICSQVCD